MTVDVQPAQRLAKSLSTPDRTEVIERVDELLELSYRSADLGNLSDPLDEAVYIVLSIQTRQPVYQAVYRQLKVSYPMWLAALEADPEELLSHLRPGGLQHQRYVRVTGLLTAIADENQRRGIGPSAGFDLTLSYLGDMTDAEALTHLTAIPGIGSKTARCILAYALNRDAFPIDTHAQRILERLGLVESTPKPNHEEVEAFVPPRVRKRLHINLVHHGRAICHTTKPRCDACVLVSFCPVGRAMVAEQSDSKPAVLELFGGAGGLGLGFRRAGYRIRAAVEWERAPAQTYRLNHPGVPVIEADVAALTEGDIQALIGSTEVDVLIAGPPCQGYSAAGRRDPSDPVNLLYREVARIARAIRPQIVLIENVPGVNRVNGVGFADRIKRSLHRAGYRAKDPYVVVASEFGVPQHRTRLIYLGRRSDLGEAPDAPSPTYRVGAYRNGTSPSGLPITPSLCEVISDLPELEAGVQLEYAELSNGAIYNASTMFHSLAVIEKIRGIGPGQGPISYRRLDAEIARTLVAGHRALPVHPWLDRAISVREAARIQGFPDDYVFAGARSTQPSQVANAVPPPMAEALALHLLSYVDS